MLFFSRTQVPLKSDNLWGKAQSAARYHYDRMVLRGESGASMYYVICVIVYTPGRYKTVKITQRNLKQN